MDRSKRGGGGGRRGTKNTKRNETKPIHKLRAKPGSDGKGPEAERHRICATHNKLLSGNVPFQFSPFFGWFVCHCLCLVLKKNLPRLHDACCRLASFPSLPISLVAFGLAVVTTIVIVVLDMFDIVLVLVITITAALCRSTVSSTPGSSPNFSCVG